MDGDDPPTGAVSGEYSARSKLDYEELMCAGQLSGGIVFTVYENIIKAIGGRNR